MAGELGLPTLTLKMFPILYKPSIMMVILAIATTIIMLMLALTTAITIIIVAIATTPYLPWSDSFQHTQYTYWNS